MQAVQPRPEIPEPQPPMIFRRLTDAQLLQIADYHQRIETYNRQLLMAFPTIGQQPGDPRIGQPFIDPRTGLRVDPPQALPPLAAVEPAPRAAVANAPPRAGVTRRSRAGPPTRLGR